MRAPRWEWRGTGPYAGSGIREYAGVPIVALAVGVAAHPTNGTGECKQHGPGFWFKKPGKSTWKCAQCSKRSA